MFGIRIPDYDTYPWCEGELKGDPDIAGIGVVSAIWATTAVTIAFSWALWYNVIIRDTTAATSKNYRSLLKCAFALSDIQLVTVFALTCSSLILIYSDSETSLYHVFIARCLAQTNLAGLGSAFLFDTRRQGNWLLRIGILGIVLLLYLYWTYVTIWEFDHWTNSTPKCFFNESIVGGWFTYWMIADLIWTPVGSLWVFAEATNKIDEKLRKWNADTGKLVTDAWKRCASFPGNLLRFQPVTAIGKIFSATWRLFAFLLITLTISPSITTPLSSTIFFIWSIYDTLRARSSNQHILVACPTDSDKTSLQGYGNPENDWGFGQLLPIFLLILPFLQIADNFTEEAEHERYASLHFINKDFLHRQGIRITQGLRRKYAAPSWEENQEGARSEERGTTSALSTDQHATMQSRAT